MSVARPHSTRRPLAGSVKDQLEGAEQLVRRARKAAEALVQVIDRIDRERGRKLLEGFDEKRVYEAAVAVIMRLVFLVAAEERSLIPSLGVDLYGGHCTVSMLRERLRGTAGRHGEETLERRHDAWVWLLAAFRAVHGGIDHGRTRLPAYGGLLFDPGRFPFLEGRTTATSSQDAPVEPLPINDRTVLHLLEALQAPARVPGAGPAEAPRASFCALEIEQFGQVYEGLLDDTAVRARGAVLGLLGTKGKEPEIPLQELDALRLKGDQVLVGHLREATGRSETALRRAMERPIPSEDQRLLGACGGETALYRRVARYAGLIRTDTAGNPVVFNEGSVYVTRGSDRRSTGTHYTPRALTEPIVRRALEPLVYEGPGEGKPKEEWTLESPTKILSLRVCDMAMGSGAFLVQACRYLAERLTEARAAVEEADPRDVEEQMASALRLVADRCIYGVDKNSMAVEIAKLSVWLMTSQADRPFTCLDHALRCGDSLLGLMDSSLIDRFRLDQLQRDEARVVADLIVGTVLANAGRKSSALDAELGALALDVAEVFKKDSPKDEREEGRRRLAARAREMLGDGATPFHWVLEFPDVFLGEKARGFDAVVGNPPFLKGHFISKQLGDAYRDYLVSVISKERAGLADLAAFFFRRAFDGLKTGGLCGLIATNTIAEGDTGRIGLDLPLRMGAEIVAATTNVRWPGAAGVIVSYAHLYRGEWRGSRRLNGQDVARISSKLMSGDERTCHALRENAGLSFNGFYVNGDGFVLDEGLARSWGFQGGPHEGMVFPYMNGIELSTHPDQRPRRWVLCTWDWTEEKVKRHERAYERLRAMVKPYREQVARRRTQEKWWLFAENRPGLSHAIGFGPLFDNHPEGWDDQSQAPDQVIVKTKTSQTWAFALVPSKIIFDQAIIVIAAGGPGQLAQLQSSIHWVWAAEDASHHKNDMRYSPALFESYPRAAESDALRSTGRRVHELRAELMTRRGEGLTSLYNRFHLDSGRDADIDELRARHAEMDRTVADAYGWDDLKLEHGLHDTKQGRRFMIGEGARREVLARLLELNHERYAEEVAQGLHERRNRKAARPRFPH